ncbi:AAA family ATPase [Mycobacterium marinum]|uniref:AAA family ATPase n=1 Tax=Mycobacterium marinum TaxID=1781 RepID=UPI00356A21B7
MRSPRQRVTSSSHSVGRVPVARLGLGISHGGARHTRSVVRLERKADAVAYRADPDSVLARQPKPVLLDEWQAVPGVLGAVKRSVDQDSRPGRFVVTGSVRAMLSAATWPGTGRVLALPMYGGSSTLTGHGGPF